jgi:cellulose biosynthesis protein BcsQ
LHIIISVYNQNGGVAKTTATYEIGYVLYKMGFKVLMIDADPQSSLTTLINPQSSFDKEAADNFDQQLQENKAKGILTRIDDIFEPALGLNRQDPVSKDRAAQVSPLLVHKYGEEDCKNETQGLYYLPGSIKIDRLNKLITLGISNVPGTQAYANMVPDLIREIGVVNSFDIILIDLNPGIFALNESIIMKSQYLLIPFKPSVGCLDSIKNLIAVVPSWFDELRKNGLLNQDEGPMLLGTFPQIIRTRQVKKTKQEFLEASYEYWIDAIFKKTEEFLQVFLDNMPVQGEIPFKQYKDRIGIRDMIGAGLQVQTSGRPLSDIDFRHTYQRKGKTLTFPANWNVLKNKTNKAYRKILGIFLKHLTDEHKKLLTAKVPNLIPTLNLYSTLFEDIERESSAAAVAALGDSSLDASTPSKKRKRSSTTQYYWYTDEDITHLLDHILQNKPNYFYTTPMQGDGRFSADQLTKNIEEYLLNHIVDNYEEGQNQTVFIPLNVGALQGSHDTGGNHWTLAIIKITTKQTEIFYFDPLGNDIPASVNDALKKVAQNVYDKKVERVDRMQKVVTRVQYDGYNCGPWVIEFVHQLINNDAPNLANIDISDRRAHYQDILKNIEREENTKNSKKTKNTSTSASQKEKAVKPSRKRQKVAEPDYGDDDDMSLDDAENSIMPRTDEQPNLANNPFAMYGKKNQAKPSANNASANTKQKYTSPSR